MRQNEKDLGVMNGFLFYNYKQISIFFFVCLFLETDLTPTMNHLPGSLLLSLANTRLWLTRLTKSNASALAEADAPALRYAPALFCAPTQWISMCVY